MRQQLSSTSLENTTLFFLSLDNAFVFILCETIFVFVATEREMKIDKFYVAFSQPYWKLNDANSKKMCFHWNYFCWYYEHFTVTQFYYSDFQLKEKTNRIHTAKFEQEAKKVHNDQCCWSECKRNSDEIHFRVIYTRRFVVFFFSLC